MNIGTAGLDLIKKFEGCRLTAYKCPAGVWTIGFGWTEGVTPGMTISRAQAEELLRKGIHKYEDAVTAGIDNAPTTQNQFDAMVSLCYNIGAGNFRKSTVLREHRSANYSQAAKAFLMWNKAGGKVLNGLVARREAEKALYLGE